MTSTSRRFASNAAARSTCAAATTSRRSRPSGSARATTRTSSARTPRDRVVPAAIRGPIREHPRGRYESATGHYVLLVDGVVGGIWEPRADAVRVQPLVELTRAQLAELEAEADRVARFLGAELPLSLGPLLQSQESTTG